jgi:hypothetical protein
MISRCAFGAVRLSVAEEGVSYEILRVYEKDLKFLELLADRDLRPGARLRVHKREYDETISISVEDSKRPDSHLGKPASERIWVRRAS